MKWVLVAVDGSVQAAAAACHAAQLATQLSHGLLLVYVAEPPPMAAAEVMPLAQIVDEHLTWARDYLFGVARDLARPRLEIRTQVIQGSPVEAVCQLAASSEIEMVAVGPHGLGALGRLVLGSVSTRLARSCPKPLLIVRSQATLT